MALIAQLNQLIEQRAPSQNEHRTDDPQPSAQPATQVRIGDLPGDLQFIQQFGFLRVQQVAFADAKLEHQMVICVLVVDKATVDQQVSVRSIPIEDFHLLNGENLD